ncbi:MAG: preprotein translocase subunit SecG [Candidatus Puniceispirillaceae bacterium]
MQTVLLTIHTLIALALVGLVLLQRNEGGGLGIGGGGGGGGFMTARGTANLLTRATAILAACFFLTSIGLGILAGAGTQQTSIVDEVLNSAPAQPAESTPSAPAVPTGQ